MDTTLMYQARDLLKELIIREAYVKEKITLSSGKESDYYIDARRVTLKPQGAYLCARLILEDVQEGEFDAIGGPTLGADPMIGAIGVLGHQAEMYFKTFIIRKEPKKHGKQQQIEGPELAEGDRVVLIDDVATTGKAFLQSIDILSRLGIKVVKAICLVDRGEGAKEAVAAKGVELVSLLDIKEIHTS